MLSLILATGFLAIPLFLRGVINIYRASSQANYDWIESLGIRYDVFLYLAGVIIPLGTQLSSLIFGHISKKKKDKYRLKYVDNDDNTNELSDTDSSDDL